MDSNKRDKRQISDTAQYIEGTSVRMNPFPNNAYADNAYKRTERIVSALYLITNHVRDEEPVRQNIRQEGLALLSDITHLEDVSENENPALRILARIRNIISLVQLLCIGGFLSRQNTSILIQALDDLGQFIERVNIQPRSEKVTLDGAQFDPITTKGATSATSSKDDGSAAMRSPSTAGDSDQKVRKDSASAASNEGHMQKQLERRALILDILKRGGKVSIKDISSRISDCSEKTLQRELQSLTLEGIVKKEGEKRWSRYSLEALS